MRSRLFVFFLMVAIVTVMVLGIFVFLSLWDSSGCPDPGKMRVIGSLGVENAPRFDPSFDANAGFGVNTGFVVNPYQADNPERDMAFIIGESVSYILSEVKYFTLFIVVLTVLALNSYALILYFVLDKIAKPRTRTLVNTESRPQTMSNAVMGHFNAGKDTDGYIKRASGMLALEIDEMLAEIDSVIEKSKLNQRAWIK